MVLNGLPIVLLCFSLILIVGPHPIFGHLMISYGLVWFSYRFALFRVDFNRRLLPDFRLSFDFPLFAFVFNMVLPCFWLIVGVIGVGWGGAAAGSAYCSRRWRIAMSTDLLLRRNFGPPKELFV